MKYLFEFLAVSMVAGLFLYFDLGFAVLFDDVMDVVLQVFEKWRK